MGRFWALSLAMVVVGCAAKSEKAASGPSPGPVVTANPTAPPTSGDGAQGAHLEVQPPPNASATATATTNGPAMDPKDQARGQGLLGPSDQRFDDSPLDTNAKTDPKKLPPTGSPQHANQPISGGEANAQKHSGAPNAGGLSISATTFNGAASSAIRTALDARASELTSCRAKAPSSSSGRLELSFSVAKDGKVSNVTRVSGLSDNELVACISGVLSSMTVARPTKPGKATVTFQID